MLLKIDKGAYAVIEGGYCACPARGGYAFDIFAEKGNLEYSEDDSIYVEVAENSKYMLNVEAVE